MKRNTVNGIPGWIHSMHLIELNEMEEEYPMVLRERNLLRRWVYSGHSVSTNPWHYTSSSGYELNYIEGYHRYLADKWGEFYRPFYRVVFDGEEKDDGCFSE